MSQNISTTLQYTWNVAKLLQYYWIVLSCMRCGIAGK